MTNKIKTIDDVQLNSEKWNEEYKYQKNLTAELDNHDGDFDQDIINQIVLWKVNRYAKPKDSVLAKLNMIDKASRIENITLTEEILKGLLDNRGFGLAMATTVLRFKNPYIYQLIDQRVYRFIFGNPMPKTTNSDKLVKLYRDYLDRLRKVCEQYNIDFCKADRILYQADILENKGHKLSGYGKI